MSNTPFTKPDVPLNPHLVIEEIEKESDNIEDALAISTERARELRAKTDYYYTTNTNIVATAHDASKECKHVNELFYISYLITRRQVSSQDKGGGLLAAILSSRKDR